MNRHLTLQILAALTAVGLGSGCYYMPREVGQAPHGRTMYYYPMRQLAPEPVYNRLRTGYLPQPLPSRKANPSDAALILPVFQFEVNDITLHEASQILANTARYHSYCAPSVAQQHISLATIGTIDELAAEIGRQAGISVIVDHNNREVRFVASNAAVEPQLPESKAAAPETEAAGTEAVKTRLSDAAISSSTAVQPRLFDSKVN